MQLKIPLLSWGLKLSNSKPGCRVSALQFFVKKIHTTGGFLTVELNQKSVLFSASSTRINPSFTAGKRIRA
jgi:hypothetical protein